LWEQRGTNELKKYLHSRVGVELEEATQPVSAPVCQRTGGSGTSGNIDGNGDGVGRFRIVSTKTLEYWSASIKLFVTNVAVV